MPFRWVSPNWWGHRVLPYAIEFRPIGTIKMLQLTEYGFYKKKFYNAIKKVG